MITANRLMRSGIVCRTPTRKVSPSGVPHCQFMLEHRSVQQEAGFSRQAWCRVPVIVSGKHLPNNHITIGAQVNVQGFISNHQGSNGLNKMVLHAEQIDLIDSRG